MFRCSRLRHVLFAACALFFLAGSPAPAADPDELEGPWGTVHADSSGTAASQEIVSTLEAGRIAEAWRLDVVAEGHDRPGGRASIVFDKDSNLYWLSSTGGGTAGVVRIVSVSPEGAIRWFGNDGGVLHPLGTTFTGASPVVGRDRVYAIGDINLSLKVAAYDKATGQMLWDSDLTRPWSRTTRPSRRCSTPGSSTSSATWTASRRPSTSWMRNRAPSTGPPQWMGSSSATWSGRWLRARRVRGRSPRHLLPRRPRQLG